MKYKPVIIVIVGTALALTSLMVFAQSRHGQDRSQDMPRDRAQVERGPQDMDRDRLRDRDRLDEPAQGRDRDRVHDRTHVPDFAKLSDQDIYGSEVMSAEERNAYRKQLQNAVSEQERNRIEEQHHEMVQSRANARGIELQPPGHGIYGGAIMSVEERSRYREQLSSIESDAEREMFKAQHREEMQTRARAQGIGLDQLEETEESD